MSAPDPVKHAWQASVTDPSLPPLDTLRHNADVFYRKIRLRNRIEYAASAVVLVCFSAYVVVLPSPTARIGAALIVIGTLFVVWQLHRRASAVPTPEQAGASSILAHTRAQLVRQRDALASVFLWYLLPFVPGLALMMVAPVIDGRPLFPGQDPRGMWIGITVTTAVFAFLWWLNRLGSRKLQKAIDDIDALKGGEE